MDVYKYNTGGWGLRIPYVYVGGPPWKNRLGTTGLEYTRCRLYIIESVTNNEKKQNDSECNNNSASWFWNKCCFD